ncbi:MAG TPA: hypothetical protein VFW48_08005, partial [Solirubrobacterales bacterium]|nr:hypothetical protein [Solirubrobacterales bacterium]
AKEIRRALIEKAAHRELQRDWASTRAQLMRLHPSEPFVRTARLLRVAPIVDAGIFIAGYIVAATIFEPSPATAIGWALAVALTHLCYYRAAMVIAKVDRHVPTPFGEFRDSLRGAFDWGALVVRLGVAVIPLVLSIAPELAGDYTLGLVPEADLEGGETLVPAAVWLYASTWSIVATAHALHEVSRAVSWPLLPLRLAGVMVWNEIRLTWAALSRFRLPRFRRPGSLVIRPPRPPDIRPTPPPPPASLASRVVSAVLTAVLIVVIAGVVALLAALPNWVPSIVEHVLALLVAAFFLLALLLVAVLYVVDWILDRRRCRRRLGPHRTNMTALEMLSCLAGTHSATNAIWILREARTRRLLYEDAEASLIMRDLLRAIERGWTGEMIEGRPKWSSPAFASWMEDKGISKLIRLRNFGHGFHDELGPLLEELERRDEPPFA